MRYVTTEAALKTRAPALVRSLALAAAATTQPTAVIPSMAMAATTQSLGTVRSTAATARAPPLEFQRSRNNQRGGEDTAVGFAALGNGGINSNNIALGYQAGFYVQYFQDYNIEIGNLGSGSDYGTIRIGDVQTRIFIAGINGIPVVGDIVVVGADGRLGTVTSSARFKKEIKPIKKASEAILALKPVSFQYKSDPTGTPRFGLIAEDVAKVNPDLVVRDCKGEIYSVRYEAVNGMLLNEFLEQHRTFLEEQRKVQEQEAAITQLKSTVVQLQKDFQTTIEQLTKRAHEQASQIQKVSAQVETNMQVSQLISSNQ